MLVLVALAYATMELKSIFPKGSTAREAMASGHYLFGLAVFFLVWLRMLARFASPGRAIDPPLPQWQARSARIMHALLYGFLIGAPLLGWMMLSAKGTPVAFLGAELPALVAKSRALAKPLEEVHEAVASAGYFLIGLHAAAALYHHYVRRDNALRLMLFSR